MLDMKFVRENPDKVMQAVANRNGKLDLTEFLELDNSPQHDGQCPGYRRCHPLALGIRGACCDSVQGQRLRGSAV